MLMSNQISPGITIQIEGKIYRVESAVKVTVAKGTPFIKTKLRDLQSEKITEKSFKLNQSIQEVALVEHQLEYLYPEGKKYLFLDIGSLEQILVSPEILGDSIHYLKEGTQVKAMFYGESIFSVELPQFLELMVIKVQPIENKGKNANNLKHAILETGAKIDVPLFVDVGDVIKLDVQKNEYVQRI